MPLRFEDDDVFFRAGDFLAVFLVGEPWAFVVLGVAFFAVPFRACDFLACDFLACDFLAEHLAGDFLEEDFRADDFLPDDFLSFFRRSRASAAPPYVSAAAVVPAITGTGCSATASATFFPAEPTFSVPEPTADDAAFTPAAPAFRWAEVQVLNGPRTT